MLKFRGSKASLAWVCNDCGSSQVLPLMMLAVQLHDHELLGLDANTTPK